MGTTYTAAEVAEKVGVPYRSLMYWVEHDMLNPTNARRGQRVETVWHTKDVREASVLANLRRAGFSLQQLKEAMAYLRSLGQNPMSTGEFIVVTVAGERKPTDIVKFCTTGEAVSLVKDRGQLVLPLWSEDMDR